MKSYTSLKTAATLTGLSLTTLAASAQTFIMPEQSIPASGPGIFFAGNPVGGLNWGAGTLSATSVINPSALTIDESGTITLAPSTSSFQFSETELITSTIQNFPNPPIIVTNSVPGTLTMNMDFLGGAYSFDTGTQSLVWNGSSYTFGAEVSIQVPLSISYSLLTGGQTYSGTDENADLNYILNLGDQLNTGDYPTSISQSAGSWIQVNRYSYTTIADFTATNGFQADIVAESPEPTTLAIVGLGGLSLLLFRRGQPK